MYLELHNKRFLFLKSTRIWDIIVDITCFFQGKKHLFKVKVVPSLNLEIFL